MENIAKQMHSALAAVNERWGFTTAQSNEHQHCRLYSERQPRPDA
ncbi:MAG: hypothetical protein U0L43_07135 [Muribaculaceae bacterium]|nr:hypothetical protein [Muribaculaceae bacterium]